MKLRCTVAVLASALAGCQSATKATLVEPATINLTDALKQIRSSLNAAAADARADRQHVGLDICTATVALTLSATGTSDNKAGGNVGVGPPVIPVTIGVNLSTQQTLVEGRSNTITLLLTTPACNPGGTLGTTNPGKVVALAKANSEVRERGYTQYSSPVFLDPSTLRAIERAPRQQR